MQKIRLYIALLAGTAVITFIGLLLTIFLLSPDQPLNQLLFYTALFLLVFSFLSLAGLYIRKWAGQREFLTQYFVVACRQGLWFAVIIVVSMMLLAHHLFSWLNATYLVLALVFLESYLIAKNDRKS